MPTTLPLRKTGAAARDRIPSLRQLATSTRGSASESSQRKALPLRTHSPDKPELVSRRHPSEGAFAPRLDRQIIEPLCASAMATPVAPVSTRARTLTDCRIRSSSSFSGSARVAICQIKRICCEPFCARYLPALKRRALLHENSGPGNWEVLKRILIRRTGLDRPQKLHCRDESNRLPGSAHQCLEWAPRVSGPPSLAPWFASSNRVRKADGVISLGARDSVLCETPASKCVQSSAGTARGFRDTRGPASIWYWSQCSKNTPRTRTSANAVLWFATQ